MGTRDISAPAEAPDDLLINLNVLLSHGRLQPAILSGSVLFGTLADRGADFHVLDAIDYE